SAVAHRLRGHPRAARRRAREHARAREPRASRVTRPGASAMRTFMAGSVEVELVALSLHDIYAGLLEGTPKMVRRYQLERFDSERERRGGAWYLHDRESIEAEIESGAEEWMAPARAQAELRGPADDG